MNYSFTYEEKTGFLHVRVSGDNAPENVRRYLRETYEAAARTGISTILLEEDLEGQALDPVDVYAIARDASAETSPIIKKIGYVDLNPERSGSNIDLGEQVARDQGVNVRAFTSVEAAEAWLTMELSNPED